MVNFNLPNENERAMMLKYYLVKYCTPPSNVKEKAEFIWKYPRSLIFGKKLISHHGLTNEIIEKIASESEGFSGREITKMVIAWHDAAFTLDDAILTPDLMFKILDKFKLQHKLKETWSVDETKLMEKLLFMDDSIMGSKTNN